MFITVHESNSLLTHVLAFQCSFSDGAFVGGRGVPKTLLPPLSSNVSLTSPLDPLVVVVVWQGYWHGRGGGGGDLQDRGEGTIKVSCCLFSVLHAPHAPPFEIPHPLQSPLPLGRPVTSMFF